MPAFCCSVLINGVLVGRTRATDKKSAKHAAAEAALELLRKICPTILESRPGNLEAALSRKDVIKRLLRYINPLNSKFFHEVLLKR